MILSRDNHGKIIISLLIRTILPVFLLTTSLDVHADTAETPLSIYRMAVKNDPQIRAAFADLQAKEEKINQSSGALLPNLKIKGEVAANNEDVSESFAVNTGETTYNSYDVALILTQPVYRKDLFTGIDITESNILVATAEYKATQQELITRILELFFKALAAHDNLGFSIAERKSIEEQLVYTKKLYNVGKTTMTDFLEAQAAFDLADAQVIIAEDVLDDALDAIEEVTGEKPGKLAHLNESFSPLKPQPTIASHWVEQAEKNNPELIAARYRVQAARYEVERYRAGHHPTLDFVARYGTQQTGGRFGDSNIDDASIALQLEVPLYSGGQVSSQVRESLSKLDEAEEDMLRVQRSIIREIKAVFRSTVTALNRIEALNVAVKSTITAVDAIRAGYKAGTRTNADLLRAQRELFKAKLDFEAAKYEYIANYFQLKNIAGKLSEDDIRQIDEWF